MAQAPTDDNLESSGDDRQIQLAERDVIELFLCLVSSVGENKKLRNERDQLQHVLYQTGNYGIQPGSNNEDCSITAKRHFQDDQTNMNISRTVQDDSPWITDGKETQIPESGGLALVRDTELLANKSHTTSSTDSGMGNGSDICSNVSRPRKSDPQACAMPDCGFIGSIPNIFGPSALETSENIDVGSVASKGQFKQLNKSTDAKIEMECDGAVGSSSLFLAGEDVFESPIQYAGSPQTLQRATSSRQDDQTSYKRKMEMKKTGSHESYFPIESKNNRLLPLQQSANPIHGQRKSSYPVAFSGNAAKGLETTDSLMISCIPKVASKNILNGVSRELRRVRKEYKKLEQKGEKMKEEIYQLRVELKDLNIKLEEKEIAIQDARIKRVDEDRMAQFESERKRLVTVEKILNDERARFARDEEHWKKEIEILKGQLRAQNRSDFSKPP